MSFTPHTVDWADFSSIATDRLLGTGYAGLIANLDKNTTAWICSHQHDDDDDATQCADTARQSLMAVMDYSAVVGYTQVPRKCALGPSLVITGGWIWETRHWHGSELSRLYFRPLVGGSYTPALAWPEIFLQYDKDTFRVQFGGIQGKRKSDLSPQEKGLVYIITKDAIKSKLVAPSGISDNQLAEAVRSRGSVNPKPREPSKPSRSASRQELGYRIRVVNTPGGRREYLVVSSDGEVAARSHDDYKARQYLKEVVTE